MPNLNPSDIKLGTFVASSRHGYIGRVTEIHFGCPESAGWIAGQSIPVDESDLGALSVWASFLVHGGGSVVQPVSSLTKIQPFALDNSWADEYFEV